MKGNGQFERSEELAYIVLCQNAVSAAGLAEALGVSLVTAARAVAGLRKKGVNVVTVRENSSWHYEVRNREAIARERWARFRRLGLAGFITRSQPMRGKSEDDIIYGEG